MRQLSSCLYLFAFVIEIGNADYERILENLNRTDDEYLHKLQLLLTEVAFVVRIERCLVTITDDAHHYLYERTFYERSNQPRSTFILHIDDADDLFAPNYYSVQVVHEIRNSQCDLFLVTVLNGLQVKRFLKFIDRYRVLNMQQRFVFLYDERLFERDMVFIWSSMIYSVFLQPTEGYKSYQISTIAYPSILNGEFVVTENVKEWKPGKRLNQALLFPDKISNLRGINLPIAIYPHIPMVMRNSLRADFVGLEIEIVETLSEAMNFEPQFFEIPNSEEERWGRELPNGTFTGLLGQLITRKAKIAIGDLHLYKLFYSVIDFSWPHSHECLTFLTPESSQDETWKTLISPFRTVETVDGGSLPPLSMDNTFVRILWCTLSLVFHLNQHLFTFVINDVFHSKILCFYSEAMWAGVLLSLFAVGTIFYTISSVHSILIRNNDSTQNFFMLLRKREPKAKFDPRIFRNVRFRAFLNRLKPKARNLDLFDSFSNCLLYTYSMLMYVSLPRMPRNWPLRVLTGWYWLYCILVTVTYRASFTAILANPAARITIDTLEQLFKSRLSTSSWGMVNKELFENAFDTVLQDIGMNLEITNEIDSVTERIAEGKHAYYDNIFFLRYLRSNGTERGSTEILHIMQECVVQMPVGLGLEKNSPLKTNIDKYLKRMREAGLLTKWLKDAVQDLKAEEQSPQEALMDLKKFWSSFVALIVGYFFGVCAIVAERLHFIYIVRKHPLYDDYNPKLYYNFKRRYPNA